MCKTVPDPDIEIRGAGHPNPYIRGGGGGGEESPKKIFSAPWASVSLV